MADHGRRGVLDEVGRQLGLGVADYARRSKPKHRSCFPSFVNPDRCGEAEEEAKNKKMDREKSAFRPDQANATRPHRLLFNDGDRFNLIVTTTRKRMWAFAITLCDQAIVVPSDVLPS